MIEDLYCQFLGWNPILDQIISVFSLQYEEVDAWEGRLENQERKPGSWELSVNRIYSVLQEAEPLKFYDLQEIKM